MSTVYILRLEEGKYYIGKTINLDSRLAAHFGGNGAVWTKKYRPLELVEKMPGDEVIENNYTLQYMKKYGIDNVRGGTFCQLVLPQSSITTINRIINANENKCYTCGESGHYANNCPKKIVICYKCNKSGHYSNACTELYCTSCKILGHTEDICQTTKTIENTKDTNDNNINLMSSVENTQNTKDNNINTKDNNIEPMVTFENPQNTKDNDIKPMVTFENIRNTDPYCNKCLLIGHKSEECPNICQYCGIIGHTEQNCQAKVGDNHWQFKNEAKIKYIFIVAIYVVGFISGFFFKLAIS